MSRIIKTFTMIIAISLLSCTKETETIYIIRDSSIIKDVVKESVEEVAYGLKKQMKKNTELVNIAISDPKDHYSGTESEEYNSSTYYYDYLFDYIMNRINSDSYRFESEYNGEYESYYLISDDSIRNNWQISQISEESDYYLLSGTTSRIGYQYSKIYEDYINSGITFNYSSIQINRINAKIKSGSIEFVCDWISSNGETNVTSGTIVFSDYYYQIHYN